MRMSKKEIIFEIVGGIPKKRIRKNSIYDAVIKALLENPNKTLKLKNGSSSGLRNAIERRFGDKKRFIVSEREGKVYARYEPN
jgi:hypothetical protein